MALTEFQKRVKRLKKKYNLTQKKIAQYLEMSEPNISACMHGKKGYSGERFLPLLQVIEEEYAYRKENGIL